MSKSLIIAEKPSVAADIARALGGFTRHADYFESDRYVLSSAIGHLLELGMPEEEEVKRGKWTFAHLPAIPSKFALKPIEKVGSPAAAAAQAPQAQGRERAGQRLRRGPRGRADLSQHRAVRQDHQADPAAVAAVDDPGRDPRRVRQAAQRRGDAAARRRGRVPVGIRLAGRHQRHARDDRVQFQVGRLPADDGGPCADADAGDPGRARGKDPRLRAPRLLGGARHVPRRRRAVRRPLVRRKIQKETTIPTGVPSVCGTRRRRAQSPSAAKASRARSPRRPSRRRRWRRCSTT